MIDSKELQTIATSYKTQCIKKNISPSKHDFASLLNISARTVYNIIAGTFNGRSYTNHPSILRCVGNDDFVIIRDLFKKGEP